MKAEPNRLISSHTENLDLLVVVDFHAEAKFPDKIKNITCFQRMKFLYSMCKI